MLASLPGYSDRPKAQTGVRKIAAVATQFVATSSSREELRTQVIWSVPVTSVVSPEVENQNPYSKEVLSALSESISGNGTIEERTASVLRHRERQFNHYYMQSAISAPDVFVTLGHNYESIDRSEGREDENEASDFENPYLNVAQPDKPPQLENVMSYLANAERSAGLGR